MKLKLKHFIPIYGMILYFREYFSAEKRDSTDAVQAVYFEMYHWASIMLWLIIILGPIFSALGIKIK